MKLPTFRIFLLLFLVTFLLGPLPFSQAQTPSPTPPTDKTTPAYILELPLPALPESVPAQEGERWFERAFDDAIQPILPELEALLRRGAIRSYRAEPSAWGFSIAGASPQLIHQLGQRYALEQVTPLPASQAGSGGAVQAASSKVQARQTQAIAQARQRQEQEAQRLAALDEHPDAPDNPPNVGRGQFRAYLFDNYIYGYTISDTVTVQATLHRGGIQIASGSATSSSYGGYYYVYLQDTTGEYVDMLASDTLEISAPGQPTAAYSLPEIVTRVNAGEDTVSGLAPVSTPITVGVYTPATGYVWMSGGTDASGAFSLDFSAQADLQYNQDGFFYLREPIHGYQVGMYFRSPSMTVRPGQSARVYGQTGQTGGGPHDVLFTLRQGNGQFIQSLLGQADPKGYYYVYFNDYLKAGQILEMNAPSGETISFAIPTLTAQADPATDIISGQAPPSSPLELNFYDYNTSSYHDLDFTSQPDGSYSASLSGLTDITPRDYGWVYYHTPQGLTAYTYFQVPYVFVDQYYRELGGYLPPDTAYTANLWDSQGRLVATTNGFSYSSGSFYAEFWDANLGEPRPIQVDDTVEIIPQGSAPVQIPVHQVTAQADLDTEIVSGVALPGMPVRVRVCWWESIYSYCTYEDTLADSAGNFQYDFSSWHDLRTGEFINIESSNSDGNIVEIGYYIPSRVYVNAWEDYAYLYTTSKAPVTITLKDALGAVKSSLTSQTSYTGYLYAGGVGDIVTGDILQVSVGSLNEGDSAVVTEVIVVPLEISLLDRPADIIEGAGPPDSTVMIGLESDEYNSDYQAPVATAADGSYHLELSQVWNLRGDDYLELVYHDSGRNRQVFDTYVPSMNISLAYSWMDGAGLPSTTGVLYLKNSQGIVKESQQVTVSPWGRWSASFSTPFEIGDRIEMHIGGQIFSLTLPTLTLSADPDTDILSGSAPANQFLFLSINSRFDFYETVLQADPGGAFSLDLSGGFDITHLNDIELYWNTQDADSVSLYKTIPGIATTIDADNAWGYAADANAPVNLRLQGPGGLKAARTVQSSMNGYFSANRFCDGPDPVDIAIGDTLSHQGSNSSVQIANITAAMDLASDTVSGFAPPNASLLIEAIPLSYSWWWWGRIWVTADANGAFSADFGNWFDLQPGDYAYISWVDAEGDQATYRVYSADASNITVSLTGYPSAANPNSPVFVNWSVRGGNYLEHSSLLWDTVSHTCDREYSNYAAWRSGLGGNFTADFQAPGGGTIYMAAVAYVDGHEVWGPEIAIPVGAINPVIIDPFNGVTNNATPTIAGFAPPGETVTFYETTRLGNQPHTPLSLGSTVANPDGSFSFTPSAPLGQGQHDLYAQIGGKTSNTIDLTINTTLAVDPNHIFFTDRGARFRIKDQNGYANLGGRIWIRPNDTVAAEIPLQCATVVTATLSVGSATYDLFDSGGGVWQGSFLLPASNDAIIANINCNGTPQSVLLAYGLVDPDGYAYDNLSLEKISGALVTCYRWDAASSQYLPWDAATWGQVNPQITDADGYYSFSVPPGDYRVTAGNYGYLDYESPTLSVIDEPVHHNLPLKYILKRIFLALIRK
jgi:hypothetical protein